MSIPNYQECMLPLLKFASDNKEHHLNEAVEKLSEQFNLTEDEKKTLLSSGQQRIISNRVGWAATYLKKCNILESTARGCFKITERGKEILSKNPSRIDGNFLKQFPEFEKFKNSVTNKRNTQVEKKLKQEESDSTPEEIIENKFEELNESLAEQILATMKNCSANFFEELVIDLLVKMGYGGSKREAGQRVGKSGDEGIDGIIKEDKLGLDAIYIQAKKWENTTIGRPEIQKFVGALRGQNAKKGIFITTSNFSKEAREYAEKISDDKIILIDGDELAHLMIENEIGVYTTATFQIKKVDNDYFDR